MKDTDIDECLWVDPFGGDDSDVYVMSDKIVTAAKEHPHCWVCHGQIAKGERHRARSEINREEGLRMTFRFCHECCVAMIENEDEDCEPGQKLEARFEIGRAARRASGEQF